MQVKKFEAKTMKEALELVKVHLGPEAIILSAKDTHRGFGLMGEKSVEVTAAVSEETLRRKKMAESKLREELRERFQQIPAAKQKEFINKVFKDAHVEKREFVHAGGGGGSRQATEHASAESRARAFVSVYAFHRPNLPPYRVHRSSHHSDTRSDQTSNQIKLAIR